LIPSNTIYVEGTAQSSHLLFLTASEYRRAVDKETLPVDAILVVDELPLSEDLPLVAGLILGRRLSLEESHVQLLAEKLSIPLIVSEEAFLDPALRALAQGQKKVELRCEQGRCSLTEVPRISSMKSRVKSVLPLDFDRSPKVLLNPRDVSQELSRELGGDKYTSLVELSRRFPKLLPEMNALSSGYYEAFLDHYAYRGQMLRTLRREMWSLLAEAEARQDENAIKEILADFREALRKATPQGWLKQDLFVEIEKTLRLAYPNQQGAFSIRSNNDVEDLFEAITMSKICWVRAFIKALK
jgi:hypothetical protein